MKKYPLKSFLRVCHIREEQAQRDLCKARIALQEALQALQTAQENYEDHKKKRPQREKELFSHIQGQNITQKRLDDFHLEVKKLVDKELELAAFVVKAQEHVLHMHKQEAAAQTHWQNTYKEQTKIEEHKKIWKDEQKILEERAEEAEMEQA